MLSSVNILYYMLFVYNNLGELHVGDRQKKKKKIWTWGVGWQNHGSGKREKDKEACGCWHVGLVGRC